MHSFTYWNAQDSDSSPSSLHGCRPRSQDVRPCTTFSLTNLRFGLRNTLILDTLASHVKLSVQVQGKTHQKDLDGRSFTEALRGMVSYDPYLLCRKLISVIRRTPCFGTSSDPLQDFGKNKVHCQIPSRGLAICTGHWWMPHSQGSRFSRWIKTACHAGGEWTAIDIHLPSFTSYLEVKYRVSFEYPYQFWMLFVLFSICNLRVWSWLCSEWGNCNPCRQRLWHTVPCGHRSVLCSVPVFWQTSRSFASYTAQLHSNPTLGWYWQVHTV